MTTNKSPNIPPTPIQALEILSEVAGRVPLSRTEHVKLQELANIIREALSQASRVRTEPE